MENKFVNGAREFVVSCNINQIIIKKPDFLLFFVVFGVGIFNFCFSIHRKI